MDFASHKPGVIGFEPLEDRLLPSGLAANDRSAVTLAEPMRAWVAVIRYRDSDDGVEHTTPNTRTSATDLGTPERYPADLVAAHIGNPESGGDVHLLLPLRLDAAELREEHHGHPWAVPLFAQANPESGVAPARAAAVASHGPTPAVTEYMLHASVDVSVPGGEEPRRTASPDLAGREAVRAPISRPVVEHPGAVNTLAETIPPADSPPLSELPEQTLLAGVIPVDLAAVADEAREFLGHVADLGADWAEGVDWPDYGWLAVSALLTGGFAHIAFVHRRRTALTVDAARAAPTPGESTR